MYTAIGLKCAILNGKSTSENTDDCFACSQCEKNIPSCRRNLYCERRKLTSALLEAVWLTVSWIFQRLWISLVSMKIVNDGTAWICLTTKLEKYHHVFRVPENSIPQKFRWHKLCPSVSTLCEQV